MEAQFEQFNIMAIFYEEVKHSGCVFDANTYMYKEAMSIETMVKKANKSTGMYLFLSFCKLCSVFSILTDRYQYCHGRH